MSRELIIMRVRYTLVSSHLDSSSFVGIHLQPENSFLDPPLPGGRNSAFGAGCPYFDARVVCLHGSYLSRLGQQTRQKMRSHKEIHPAPLAVLISFDDFPMSSAYS